MPPRLDRSPNKPWITGVHPGEYTGYKLVVNVCEDALGRVWSDHEFASAEDEAAALSTNQGGAMQIAHALFTEAVRRELFVDVLTMMTQDPTFLVEKWGKGSPEEREKITTHLGEVAQELLRRKLVRMVPGLLLGLLQNLGQR